MEINIKKGEFTNPKAGDPDRALKMEIQTEQGELRIHSELPKINIDTYGARSSMGYGNYNNLDLNKRNARDSISIAYEGVARIASEGDQLARGMTASQIAAQNNRAGQTIQTIMEFLPKEGADVTFDEGVLNINYDAAEVSLDVENAETTPFEFTPGKVEFEITQLPKVTVEYLGRPIYVPPQADPEYAGSLDTQG